MDIALALLAIMGLIYVILFAGAGARSAARGLLADNSLPEGVERIRVHHKTARSGLILVTSAWYLRDYGIYVARIQCSYTNDYARLEATSVAELEQMISDTMEKFSRHIDEKDSRR